jgi:DNA-binding transcriptional regulator YiaG
MNVCGKCESPIANWRRLERHQHVVGGARVELMDSALEHVCETCGERGVIIPNLLGLFAAVAISRAQNPVKLNGREIRFLRKTLAMPAKDLADMLEVSPETVSRWECDRQPMSPSNERIFRMKVVVELAERAPAMETKLDELPTMKLSPIRNAFDSQVSRFMLVRFKKDGKKDSQWDSDLLEAA